MNAIIALLLGIRIFLPFVAAPPDPCIGSEWNRIADMVDGGITYETWKCFSEQGNTIGCKTLLSRRQINPLPVGDWQIICTM